MVEAKPNVESDGTPKPNGSVEEEQKQLDKEQLDKAENVEEKTNTQHLIDRATEENDRRERLQKKDEELLERKESLRAKEILGGRSEVTEKETPADKQKAASKALLPDDMECPGVTD